MEKKKKRNHYLITVLVTVVVLLGKVTRKVERVVAVRVLVATVLWSPILVRLVLATRVRVRVRVRVLVVAQVGTCHGSQRRE